MTAYNKKTPVAVFTYNRPEHTERAMQALSRCDGVEGFELFLYSDAPRTEAHLADVQRTRMVLRKWAAILGAQIIERPQNLGLAKSIGGTVTELCDIYGRVVVIEDDLIVSPDFLTFMRSSLEHYENHHEVMQVAGFTLSPPNDCSTDTFLLPVTSTWGWATWQRAWKSFSWVPEDLEQARADVEWLDLFNLHGTCSFSAMLEARLAKRNDSWGILWWYAVSRQRGLVLYPATSLVWNGGFDGSGIHCGDGGFLQQGESSNYAANTLNANFTFPLEVNYIHSHLNDLEDFFRKAQLINVPAQNSGVNKATLNSLIRRVREKVKNAIR
jgi:hypothetical protein